MGTWGAIAAVLSVFGLVIYSIDSSRRTVKKMKEVGEPFIEAIYRQLLLIGQLLMVIAMILALFVAKVFWP